MLTPAPVQPSVNVAVLLSAPVVSLPLVPRAPDHAPEAVQLVAFVLAQFSVAEPPGTTEVGDADNETVGADGAVVTVTVTPRLADPPAPSHASVNVLVALSGADCSLPEVVFCPAQAPEALQPVAFCEDHVRVDREPLVTELGDAASATVGAGSRFTVKVRCVVPPLPLHASV